MNPNTGHAPTIETEQISPLAKGGFLFTKILLKASLISKFS
jgi:hypothetical protein